MWQKFCLLGLLLTFSCAAYAGTELGLGSPAPLFQGKTVEGKPFNLANQLGTKATLLLFFTSWSSSSQQACTSLQTLAKTPGLQIYGISFDRKTDELKKYLADSKLTFPIIHDKKLALLKDYRILIIPTLYLLDGQGNIQNIYVDFDDNVAQAVQKEATRTVEQ